MTIRLSVFFVFVALAAALPRTAHAQNGYELALYGVPHAELGGELRVSGVAYRVRGLADLDPFDGGEVWARFTRYVSDPRTGAGHHQTVSEQTVRCDGQGRFAVVLAVPEEAFVSPQLQIEVRRPGTAGRTFTWGVNIVSPLRLDLLTDRRLYEPGERVRMWMRLVRSRTDAPVGDRRLRVRMTDAQGRPLLEREIETGVSGAVTLEHELAPSAAHGNYGIVAQVIEGTASATAQRTVQVGMRTVERLLVTTELERPLVAPAGRLAGRVIVRTPSGSPVQGARVEIRTQARGEPMVTTTDGEGIARFNAQAPAFLSGDVATQFVDVRVSHPAHGALHDRASYLLSRTQWVVSAVPSNGGLVPELDGFAYVSVADPRGTPAPAGTEIVATGLPVRGGRAALTTDAHGMAIVPMRLPAGAAAPISSHDAGCDGSVATTFEVAVGAGGAFVARVCVRAATEAQIAVRVRDAVVGPSQEVAFDVQRRPEVRTQPVIAEAIVMGRAVAWTWLAPNETRGVLTLPADVAGVIDVRARPATPPGTRMPSDEDGAAAVGTGAVDAVLVRPPDAFTLAIQPAQDVWRVRERARVGIRTTPAAPRSWVALLARDLAAHGGEQDWSLRWLASTLREEVLSPGGEEGEALIRAALAAGISPDSEPVRPTPLDPPPWQEEWRAHQRYQDGSALGRGQMRDPIAMREELLRRGIGAMMVYLEQVIASLDGSDRALQGILRRTGGRTTWDPDVIANLVRQNRLSENVMKTLGDEPVTVAMLQQADPSFTFDNVARRIARGRLVSLLLALARFTNPDDPNAARASSGEPPDRWLSRIAQLGMVPQSMLVDPWGRPYVFRRVGAERAALVVSQRAPDYELVSSGPDGRPGTPDDVRDPFARVVTAKTPYAVASGEDRLIKALSALAPGPRVLQMMAASYASVGQEAREEAMRQIVTATASEEESPPPVATAAPSGGASADAEAAGALMGDEVGESFGFGGLGLRGTGRGGGGTGEGTIGLGQNMPAAQRAQAAEDGSEGDDRDEGGERERRSRERQAQQPATPGGSRLAVAGELVRERFPATLHFVGEVAIDDAGGAVLEVPLADALTTYRLEAIGWSASGWTVSARGHVRVDQDAMVDAPVPRFGTAGDVVRVPVRVANRTGQALAARVEIAAEGGLRIRGTEPVAVEVPPNDAVEVVTEVRLGDAAEGFLVIRAVRAADGSPLDAVRRPMQVLPDARLVRETFELLVESGSEVTVNVPAEATPRGPGEVRVAIGAAIFGDPAEWGASDPVWASWTLAVAGERIPDEHRAWARGILSQNDGNDELYGDPESIALAVAISWRDRAVRDNEIRRGLRAVSRVLEGSEDDGQPRPAVRTDPATVSRLARTLLHLWPAARAAGERRAARGDLQRLLGRLRREVGSGAAAISDDPIRWAEAAAALATTRGSERDARAEELLRRASREVISVGDEAWLESPTDAGRAFARVEPTALLAIARTATGDRQGAMPLVRSLAHLARGAQRWPGPARALAAASVATLSPPGRIRGAVRIEMDGRALRVRDQGRVRVAVLEGIGRPGEHTVRVRLPENAVALAWIDARWGVPWTMAPERGALIDLMVEGPIGARDTRAGLQLVVQNRGARLLAAPVVEIDLPAGTELDAATTARLETLTTAAPTVEGRVLRLKLRPLAPGARTILPLPVRWSVAGVLRGLGASAWDESTAPAASARPTAVLPSRPLDIPDRGEEPATPEAQIPEPPPRPIPLPEPIDVLAPLARVSRGGR